MTRRGTQIMIIMSNMLETRGETIYCSTRLLCGDKTLMIRNNYRHFIRHRHLYKSDSMLANKKNGDVRGNHMSRSCYLVRRRGRRLTALLALSFLSNSLTGHINTRTSRLCTSLFVHPCFGNIICGPRMDGYSAILTCETSNITVHNVRYNIRKYRRNQLVTYGRNVNYKVEWSTLYRFLLVALVVDTSKDETRSCQESLFWALSFLHQGLLVSLPWLNCL